jgi:hypothetical protein
MLTLNSSIKALREAMANMPYDSEIYEMYNGYINIKKEKNKTKYQQQKKDVENGEKAYEHLQHFYYHLSNKKELRYNYDVDKAYDTGYYVARITISEELFNYRISNGTYVNNGAGNILNSQNDILWQNNYRVNNYIIQETRNFNDPIPDNIKEAYEIRKNDFFQRSLIAENIKENNVNIANNDAYKMASQILYQRDPNMDAYYIYHNENTIRLL